MSDDALGPYHQPPGDGDPPARERARRPIPILLGVAVGAALGVALVWWALTTSDDEPQDTAIEASAGEAAGEVEAAPVGDPDPDAEPVLVTVPQIESSPPLDVPSALSQPFDEAHPEPLVDPRGIRSGGPPPDGIPPIDEPVFEPVGTVAWLEDREPVLALELDGDARAYPLQIMTWHELVNDTFGDRPITISYCPLCNSAVAYDRRVPDADLVLDFGTSGSLYNSALVMYDRQTESLWSHFTAQAIVGHLAGVRLDTVPVALVSWAEFRDDHPEGLVLSRQTGFRRDYGRNPYPGYDDVDSSPFLFDREADPRLPAQTRVVAVQGSSDSVAVVADTLRERRVVPITVDGEDLVVLLSRGTASALDSGQIPEGRDVGATGVFRPVVDGRVLQFEPDGDQRFRDTETGSTWTVLGRAVDGPLAGSRLEAVPHLDTFWFAIAAFRPETVIVG
jgi:hypothetical protein